MNVLFAYLHFTYLAITIFTFPYQVTMMYKTLQQHNLITILHTIINYAITVKNKILEH